MGLVRGLPPLQEAQRGLSGAEGARNPLTRSIQLDHKSFYLSFCGTRAPSTPLVDLPSLFLAEGNGVDAVLGEPTECTPVSLDEYGPSAQCAYWGGNIETLFTDGRANRFTVYASRPPSPDHPSLDVKAGPDALDSLGLEGHSPVSSPQGLHYSGTVGGVEELWMRTVSGADDTLASVEIRLARS